MFSCQCSVFINFLQCQQLQIVTIIKRLKAVEEMVSNGRISIPPPERPTPDRAAQGVSCVQRPDQESGAPWPRQTYGGGIRMCLKNFRAWTLSRRAART